jgi:serine/threonine protein phosphatase PrpC
VLRGRDQVHVGQIATIAEGAAAIALSRGGAPKTYGYVDPNEDCAGFARGDGGALLVVGDAHNGCDASEIAVDTLLARFGEAWTGPAPPTTPWPELAARGAGAAHAAILERAARGGNPDSRSTLVFALLRPDEGRIGWASLGDSHVFRVGSSGTDEVGRGRDSPSWFVGSARRTPLEIGEHLRSGTLKAHDTRALVLASDGLSEQRIGVEDPAAAVAEAAECARGEAVDLRPLALARRLVEIAQSAQRRNRAGDNIAAAAFWLG